MSDVTDAYERDRQRWAEYRSTDDEGWDTPDPRVSYTDDPTEMTDDQIVRQHDDLLRLQRRDVHADRDEMAKAKARRRMALWSEADDRGITNRLDE